MRRKVWFASVIAVVFSLGSTLSPVKTSANEIYLPVSSPVTPAENDVVPRPDTVPGKLYTDRLDLTHVPTPHAASGSQLGNWDGLGGARDGQLLGLNNTFLREFNVDAQAQINDRLFDGVVNNRNPLIVSAQFDSMLGNDTALAAERVGGSVQTFAIRNQVVDHNHAGGLLRDVDSVDLWGPESEFGHSGHFSFTTDPNNTSVYVNVLGGPAVNPTPYLSRNDIANAIGDPNIAPLIDVDALMVRDIGSGINPFDSEFNPGDAIMFSIVPIDNTDGSVRYDGGEIWVWEHGSPAEFLKHGGHTWDTAFDVSSHLRINTENIDALEAVGVIPEPGSLALLVGGAIATIATRRRTIA